MKTRIAAACLILTLCGAGRGGAEDGRTEEIWTDGHLASFIKSMRSIETTGPQIHRILEKNRERLAGPVHSPEEIDSQARIVRRWIGNLKRDLPAGITLSPAFDKSADARTARELYNENRAAVKQLEREVAVYEMEGAVHKALAEIQAARPEIVRTDSPSGVSTLPLGGGASGPRLLVDRKRGVVALHAGGPEDARLEERALSAQGIERVIQTLNSGDPLAAEAPKLAALDALRRMQGSLEQAGDRTRKDSIDHLWVTQGLIDEAQQELTDLRAREEQAGLERTDGLQSLGPMQVAEERIAAAEAKLGKLREELGRQIDGVIAATTPRIESPGAWRMRFKPLGALPPAKVASVIAQWNKENPTEPAQASR